MSRYKDLGKILEKLEGREYMGGIPKETDVKIWEELQRHMEENGARNELHMLTIEAKDAVYQAYESAKKVGLTGPYTLLLANRLTNGKDMKKIERWAKNYIKMYEKSR